MRTILCFLIVALACTHLFSQELIPDQTSKSFQYDRFGRHIMNEKGEKILYPFSNTSLSDEIQVFTRSANSTSSFIPNNKSGNVISCDPAWKYTIMGTCIGRRSLCTSDLDDDGIVEIICSAQPGGFYGGYWGYWYILKYNAANQQYEHDWVSNSYESIIRRLTISDLDNDGITEIFVGFDNGNLLVFNSVTKDVIGQITIPGGSPINDIQIGDADNNGHVEIAVSDEDNIYLFNPSTFSLTGEIPYGCADFKIGDVDTDDELEIVTTLGKVLEYNGTDVITEWSYDNPSGDNRYMVELSDIDSDGMKEIIRARSWDYIDVYDVNTQTLKYEIESDLDIHALLLQDVNNDGIDEIIYGDGQWGSIYCINAVNQVEMWHVDNPDHGITGISIADVDNDDVLEVMWGAGWTSTGADYLHIAAVTTQSIEWSNIAIDGPFYAIDYADIDNDGVIEIVAVSRESGSGYDSGIISVFNAESHELEWQCDGNFLYMIWTGIFDVEISDIDSDGVQEIIIAAGQTYTGKIWIIDGITKEIESSHLFSTEDIDEFYVLSAEDVDDDGVIELITGNSNKLYIINPSDFAVEWSSGNLSGYYTPTTLLTGNLDADPATEIVFSKGYIYVVDGKSQQQWNSISGNYSTTDLFDFNNDGQYEIVAGNENGFVHIIDGTSHEVINSFKVCDEKIDGIKVSDLNEDDNPEFVFTSEGTVYFYSDTNAYQHTQKYTGVAGRYNGLKVVNTGDDGDKEILFGTSYEVIELSADCYQCLWFHTTPAITTVSCGGVNDGSILPNASGGISPYAYAWSTGSSDPALYNLPAGTYSVTITDIIGCQIVETYEVTQSELITDYAKTNVTCDQTDNGTAIITIEKGTPPFAYSWSTGDTTASISHLTTGIYSVTIQDARNCTSSETIQIDKDTLIFDLYSSDISCYSYENGSVSVYVYEGTPPYSYVWSNGATSSSIHNLAVGKYSVTVTDASGCYSIQTATINEPDELLTLITTTPDDINTPFGEGTANINVIGGSPPYEVYWNDPFNQTGIIAYNLLAGVYIATVVDNDWCQKTDTAYVDSVLSIDELLNYSNIKLYPNPSGGIIYLEIDLNGVNRLDFQIHDYMGRLVYNEQLKVTDKATRSIDLSFLNTGLYCVSLTYKGNRLNYYIELVR